MTDDQILKARLTDLAKMAYNQNIYTYSNFLSIYEQASLDDIRDNISYIKHTNAVFKIIIVYFTISVIMCIIFYIYLIGL